jgi:hypothetical protein
VTDEKTQSPVHRPPLTLDDYVVEVPQRPVWYKRTPFLAGLAVLVVIAVSVLSDLPGGVNNGSDASQQTSIMNEVNGDLRGCAFSAQESFTVYQGLASTSLSPTERSLAPSMLRDDRTACSFTNSDIFDLSEVEPTGTPAGKDVGSAVEASLLWVTADALKAIIDIQAIDSHTATSKTLADLRVAEVQLSKDRAAAIADVRAANTLLGSKIPLPQLPALPVPPATS